MRHSILFSLAVYIIVFLGLFSAPSYAHTLPEVYMGAILDVKDSKYTQTDNITLIINGIVHFNDFIFLSITSLGALFYFYIIKKIHIGYSGTTRISFLILFIFVIFYFIGFVAKQVSASTLIYPSGGELIELGQIVNVTWTLDGADHSEASYITTGSSCAANNGGTDCGSGEGWSCICHSTVGADKCDSATVHNWTAPSISTTTARIRIEGHTNPHGASGASSCSGNFTIDQTPRFNTNMTSSPNNTQYLPNGNYGFQINWTDNAGINTTLFETNFNASLKNFTVGCAGTQTNKLCTINFTDLKAGNYQYRWYANDTINLFNNTGIIYYSVSKNTTNMKLWLNDSESDRSYIRYTYANFTAQLDLPNRIINMTSNMTGFSAQNSTTSVIYNTTNMTQLGVFNMTAWFDGNENYTSASRTWHATVITADTMPPQYSSNSTNNTLGGSPIEFMLRWADQVDLSKYIFSFDNGTGTFVNDTALTFLGAGIVDWSNATKTVNSTPNTLIRWKVYANDTAGNMNGSEIFSLTTAISFMSFIAPTDANGSVVARNWTYINASVESSENADACLLGWNSGNFTMTKTGAGRSIVCSINKTDVDGNYSYKVYANDTLGNSNSSDARTIQFNTGPPKSITGLVSTSKGTDYITWSWTNPDDADFSHVKVYKDGIFLANVTSPPYSFTGLSAGATYLIATQTVDNVGNINTSWVNSSDTTSSQSQAPSGGGGYYETGSIIRSPLAGAVWFVGQTYTIDWASINIDHFEITYTTDPSAPCAGEAEGTFGGTCSTGSWNCIVPHPYASGSYKWRIPNTISDTVRIRIENHNALHNVVDNYCSGKFSIKVPITAENETNATIIKTTQALIENSISKTVSVNGTSEIQFDNFIIPKITVFADTEIQGLIINIVKYGAKPQDVLHAPGSIFSYLQISLPEYAAGEISNISVFFTVNKSWIQENSIDKSTIRLSKFKDDVWNSMKTTMHSEDNSTITFQAYLKGFSFFAIVGDQKEVGAQEVSATKLTLGDMFAYLTALSIVVAVVFIFIAAAKKR